MVEQTPISRDALVLIAEMLESMVDEFAQHGCNDFTRPCSSDFKDLFLSIYDQRENRDGSNICREDIAGSKDELFIYDDWVIDYLARRLKVGLAHPRETSVLNQAELDVLTQVLYDGYTWHSDDEDKVSHDLTLPLTSANTSWITAVLDHAAGAMSSGDPNASIKRVQKRVGSLRKQIDTAKGTPSTVDIPDLWIMHYFSRKFGKMASGARQLSWPAVSEQQAAAPDEKPLRLGVNGKWERGRQRWLTNLGKWYATFIPHTDEHFRYYVATGTPVKLGSGPDYQCEPPLQPWERDSFQRDLFMRAILHLFELQRQVLKGKPFNVVLAKNAFAAARMAQMVELEGYAKSQLRRGKQLYHLNQDSLAFTALGLVLDCEEAVGLAKLDVVAYQEKAWYSGKAAFVVHGFIVRLMADYFCETPVVLIGYPAEEPVYNALFANWRTSDLVQLSALCLAACDLRTHYTRDGELENGQFEWFPIEIMLLFKLRANLGLPNPKLDHPLMNTELGVLPTVHDTTLEYDPVLAEVRERMIRDGYDEAAIARLVLG